MKLVHAILINAPTRNVWKSLSSPDVWPSIWGWGKAGDCQHVGGPEGVEVGSLYDMDLRCGPCAASIRCEIVGLRPGSMLAVRCVCPTMRHVPAGGNYHVTYELNDEGFGTTVIERFEMTSFGVAIDCLVWLVAWLMYPFHRLARNTCLQRLKGIVEGTRSP
ncbi:MAG: SRPBCC family protein [Pirellulaceae bacterium]